VSGVGGRKACVLFLLSGLLACAPPKSPAPLPPTESPAARFERDPAAVDRGRRIFIGTCGAYCHSSHNVERDAPSLFDCEWKHGGSDADIFRTISTGVPGTRMPPWRGVLPEGDDDIWRVIAYLRSASTCKLRPAASAH
jgi:mono/diheme cytochrome c family protein